MKSNMSTTDRIIRAVAAVILLSLALTQVLTGIIGTIAIVVGIVLLLTATVGFCPLYALTKINTKQV